MGIPTLSPLLCCSIEKGIVYVQDKGCKIEVITYSYRLSQHRGLLILKYSQVAEWKDDRETFPRMKVHTGSNPVLITMSKRYSVRLVTFFKKVMVVKKSSTLMRHRFR